MNTNSLDSKGAVARLIKKTLILNVKRMPTDGHTDIYNYGVATILLDKKKKTFFKFFITLIIEKLKIIHLY